MEYNMMDLYNDFVKFMIRSGDLASNVFLEIKTLCFLNIIDDENKYFNNINYSDSDQTNGIIFKTANLIGKDNKELSMILTEICNTSVFTYNEVLNEINLRIKNLTIDQKKALFDICNDMSESNLHARWSTSKQLIQVIMDCVDFNQVDSVLDLCSGIGSFLGECAKKKNDLYLEGYEIYQIALLVSKMHLYIHNTTANLHAGDVLLTKIENKFDLVLADFPWGIRSDIKPIDDDNMYVEYKENKQRSDWNFILKAVNAMKKGGKAIVLAPQSVLFSSRKSDIETRKEIVSKSLLETVILMPAASISCIGASYVLMVFSNGNESVKLIDASEAYINTKGAYKFLDFNKIHELRVSTDSEKVRNVTLDEIAKSDYSLEFNFYFSNISNIQLTNPKTIGEIGEVFSGYQYTSKNLTELNPGKGNISIVKISNLINGSIDYSSMISANIDEAKVEKYLLHENDILLSSKGTMIKGVVVKDIGEQKIIPHNNLLVIRITDSEVNPIYVCNYLNSKTGQLFLKTIQTGGIIININRTRLMDLPIPIVDKDSQEIIATRYLIMKEKVVELQTQLYLAIDKLNSIYDDELGVE